MSKVATLEAATDRAVLTHVMVDMYGVNPETLNDPSEIGEILTGAAAAATLHPLAEPAVYRYPGQGLTVFLPIRESHFAIHTYPEHGYASVDIVSCALAERAQHADMRESARTPTSQHQSDFHNNLPGCCRSCCHELASLSTRPP